VEKISEWVRTLFFCKFWFQRPLIDERAACSLNSCLKAGGGPFNFHCTCPKLHFRSYKSWQTLEEKNVPVIAKNESYKNELSQMLLLEPGPQHMVYESLLFNTELQKKRNGLHSQKCYCITLSFINSIKIMYGKHVCSPGKTDK
jgi:hypothetical protein